MYTGSHTLVRGRVIGWALAACLSAPSVARATVEVNVTHIGFPALQRGDVVRSGQWAPVMVDLAMSGEAAVFGTVRIGRPDIDGDEAYDQVRMNLRAETGGTQRLYLYVLPNAARQQDPFFIELFDEQGEALQVVSQGELGYQARPAQPPQIIPDDDILVLSVSTGTLGRISELADIRRQERFTRAVHVAHISPSDLPELWIGLESVDYIVWDDARPEDLNERRLSALLTWVRQGGTLLLAASRTAPSVVLTPELYAVLPVELGEVTSVDDLPMLRRRLLDSSDDEATATHEGGLAWWEVPFPNAVPIVHCTLRDGAERAVDSSMPEANLIVRRRLGRGGIIYSGVTMRDLLSAGGSAAALFQRLFHLTTLTVAEEGRPRPASLFSAAVSAVSFATSGGFYLAVAFLFSIGYSLAATFGTWSLLGAKGWRRHSWTAFAVVGGVASLLSVVAVNAMRGFGIDLHQISVLDINAGETRASGTAYFGVKTGTDRRLDLWLPSDSIGAAEPEETANFLRPIPVGSEYDEAASSFADPVDYRLVPASALVVNVRIRGTLKRFEGRWNGSLTGTVKGKLTVHGRFIQPGSMIVNELGVDLRDCYLLHTLADPMAGGAFRSNFIYAFPVGDLPADGKPVDLAGRCYPASAEELKASSLGTFTLAETQKYWGGELRSLAESFRFQTSKAAQLALGQEQNALLLLSTVGEYDAEQDATATSHMFGREAWSRDRARQLDMRRDLRRDTAILIGFADDPGPIRLFHRSGDRRYQVLEPEVEKSWTMYRVRLPVELIGKAPVLEEDEGEGLIE